MIHTYVAYMVAADKVVDNMDDMVADMEVDKVADMEEDNVADMEVDKVADMEVNKVADREVNMAATSGNPWNCPSKAPVQNCQTYFSTFGLRLSPKNHTNHRP